MSKINPIDDYDRQMAPGIFYYDTFHLIKTLSEFQLAAFSNNSTKRQILSSLHAFAGPALETFDRYYRERDITTKLDPKTNYQGTIVCTYDPMLSSYFSTILTLTQSKQTGKQAPHSGQNKHSPSSSSDGDPLTNDDAILSFAYQVPAFISTLAKQPPINLQVIRFGFVYAAPKAITYNYKSNYPTNSLENNPHYTETSDDESILPDSDFPDDQ